MTACGLSGTGASQSSKRSKGLLMLELPARSRLVLTLPLRRVDEKDVEVGEALLVSRPSHRRPQLRLVCRLLPGDELRMLLQRRPRLLEDPTQSLLADEHHDR